MDHLVGLVVQASALTATDLGLPYVTNMDHLVGLVVQASALTATDLGWIPAFPMGIFPGGVTPLTL